MTHFTDAAFNRAFKLSTALVFITLLCTVTTAQALPRQVADAEVKSCRFISWVSGDSGYGKNNDWKGSAQQVALRQAERLGASDVVWERYTPTGSFNGMVDGKVYLCDSQAKTKAIVAR